MRFFDGCPTDRGVDFLQKPLYRGQHVEQRDRVRFCLEHDHELGSDGMSSPEAAVPRTPISHIVCLMATVLLVGIAAGCGGSSLPAKDAVQDSTWTWVKGQVGDNVSVNDVGCVEDGDAGHWKCLTTLQMVGGTTRQVSVSVTCDEQTCLYEET